MTRQQDTCVKSIVTPLLGTLFAFESGTRPTSPSAVLRAAGDLWRRNSPGFALHLCTILTTNKGGCQMNKAKVFVCYTTHLFTAGCNGIDKQLVSSGGDRRENKQRPGVTAHIGLVLGAEKEGVQVHPFLDVASRQYSMFIMKLGMGNLECTQTILIVDDEISDLSLTRAMLTRYGYTVLTASSAAE